MPPKASKPAAGDSITLTDRDATAIRAAFLSGGPYQYNSTAIGTAVGLGAARNGGRVFQAAIAKLGLAHDNKDGTFTSLVEGEAAAAPTSTTANATNAAQATPKKRKATTAKSTARGSKKVKVEQEDQEDDGKNAVKNDNDSGEAENEDDGDE